jgi:hypothetical protein
MLRPRDSHDLRLIRTNLNFSPAASVRWIHDVFGNSIAITSFVESAAADREQVAAGNLYDGAATIQDRS